MSRSDVPRRVLEAAGPVFAEKGYERATVREICRRAGVNVASINYYFGGKRQLYAEVVRRAHQPEGEEDGLLEWPPGTPPERKLREFIRALLARVLTRRVPWQRQLMTREMLQPSFAARQLMRKTIRARFAQLLGILDELLPAEVPVYRRHQIAFSIVGQALHYHVAGEVVGMLVGQQERAAHYGLDELAEHIAQFTLAALGREPPLGRPARRRQVESVAAG